MLRLVSSTESNTYSVGRGSFKFPMAVPVPVIALYVEIDSRLSVDNAALCDEFCWSYRDRC